MDKCLAFPLLNILNGWTNYCFWPWLLSNYNPWDEISAVEVTTFWVKNDGIRKIASLWRPMSCIKMAVSPMVPMVKYIQTRTGSWGGGMRTSKPFQRCLDQVGFWWFWDKAQRKPATRPGWKYSRKSHFKKSWELVGFFQGTLMSGRLFFWKVLLMMGFYSCSTLSCFSKCSTFGMATHTPK